MAVRSTLLANVMRCASLKSETTQILVLVKYHLHLAQERAMQLLNLIDGR